MTLTEIIKHLKPGLILKNNGFTGKSGEFNSESNNESGERFRGVPGK